MKIAYPALGQSEKDKYLLSKDFVESGVMGVLDLNTGTIETIAKDSMTKGLIETLSDLSITTVITPELKIMALKVFREQGIEVYKAIGDGLSSNIELLNQSRLLPYSVIQMFSENSSSCGSSASACSSCSSTGCSQN